ncbi:hypothetical protein GCM10023215_54350 [Pseudonocardia yuanmonensis]|uniref:LysM domain-containing protein n=1 Tax=Pseudonocardia yuanmonensis TaxID=1095914 RepID=A0ABP8XHJ3_9PSEU
MCEIRLLSGADWLEGVAVNGAGIAEGVADGRRGGALSGARIGGGRGVSRALGEGVGVVEGEGVVEGGQAPPAGARERAVALEARRARAGTPVDGRGEAGFDRGPRPVRPARTSRRARRAASMTAPMTAPTAGPLAAPTPRSAPPAVGARARPVRSGPGAAVVGPGVRRGADVGRPAVRVLPRAVPAARYRLRRAVAVVAIALASAAVVVVLGLLAGVAGDAHARAAVPAGTAQAVVEPGESVWDVARRVVPPDTARAAGTVAVVERIAAENDLPVDAAPLPAGLVLRVPA